jgi:hypothetical protein
MASGSFTTRCDQVRTISNGSREGECPEALHAAPADEGPPAEKVKEALGEFYWTTYAHVE